jgi:hypothetical protein
MFFRAAEPTALASSQWQKKDGRPASNSRAAHFERNAAV